MHSIFFEKYDKEPTALFWFRAPLKQSCDKYFELILKERERWHHYYNLKNN